MAVRSPFELALLPAYIRSGNHAAHLPLVSHRQLPGNLAAAVQLVKSEGLLVSADLKHRIGRGVDDHVSGRDLMLAILV